MVVTRILPGVRQSLADGRENMAASIEATGGERRPLLLDLRDAEPLDPDVRHFYTGEVLRDAFTAIGLLVHANPLGRMMGNIYIRVARPAIPVRLFTDESSALAWLHLHP